MKFINQITNKGIIVGLHKGLVTSFPKRGKKKAHFYHHRADFCHGSYNNTMNYLKPKRSLVCLLWARGNRGKVALPMGTGQPCLILPVSCVTPPRAPAQRCGHDWESTDTLSSSTYTGAVLSATITCQCFAVGQ